MNLPRKEKEMNVTLVSISHVLGNKYRGLVASDDRSYRFYGAVDERDGLVVSQIDRYVEAVRKNRRGGTTRSSYWKSVSLNGAQGRELVAALRSEYSRRQR